MSDVSPEAKAAWEAYEKEVRDACHAPGALARYVRSCNPEGIVEDGPDAFHCRSPIRRNKHSSNFYVYPGDRGYNDFGSHEGGDMLAFIRRLWNLTSYRDVLDKAAVALGIPTWEERKGAFLTNGASHESVETLLARFSGEYVDEARVFDCCTWLANLCASILPESARAHLREHYGMTDEYITLERVGYVPPALWELVKHPPQECPYDTKTLLSTGWFWAEHGHCEPGAGKVEAVFADRIVFQYWKDSSARYTIARKWFGGLTEADLSPEWVKRHPWEAGKYKKLPTRDAVKRPYVSPFITNTILWGEDCLRLARGGCVIVTEGITDAMILSMLGFLVISPVTVAFAAHDIEHVVDLLRRVQPRRVILCNDSEASGAGLKGAMKMAETLWSAGYKAAIAKLVRPEGTEKIDVNEFVTRVMRAT